MIKKTDWKTQPVPDAREDLGYVGFLSEADVETLMSGHRSVDMDDRWFIYSEDDWIYFVRSWTGHHIFALRLSVVPAGSVRVAESWVNANPAQYRSQGKANDIQIVKAVIKSIFDIEGQQWINDVTSRVCLVGIACLDVKVARVCHCIATWLRNLDCPSIVR